MSASTHLECSICAEAAKAYPKGSPHLLNIVNFFNELGLAYESGIVTSQDVYPYFRDPILLYWCGWQQWVRDMRVHAGEDPDKGELHREFQLLFGAVRRENERCLPQPEI